MSQNHFLSKSQKRLFLSTSLSLILCSTANADISGNIFRDYNSDSTQDAGEPGVSGIVVNAYDDAGALAATDTTDATGAFDLATGTAAETYRVELGTLPSYLQPSANTGSGGASVSKPSTFNETDGASGIKIGLHNPAEYTDEDADIAMTFQAHTDGTQGLFSVRILRDSDIPATYDNNGASQSTHPINGDIASTITQTGSIWGAAYDPMNKDLYVAASVRRHTPLGSLGTGGIYKINPTTFAVSNFTTVANTGAITANASRNLQSNSLVAGNDPIFDEVGRNGLGDIDLSEDGTKLYTINTNTNELVEIAINNSATVNHITYPIGNPFGSANCPNASVTSWGIGQHNGKVYVGSVCTTNLIQGAYISELNGGAFSPFHQISLNMQGETSYTGLASNHLAGDARWTTWFTNPSALFDPVVQQANGRYRFSFPSPILSDIIFDENDGMIFGFSDRTAMQAGHDNFGPPTITNPNRAYWYDSSGDLTRACKVGGTYFNEGHANCPQQAARTVPATSYTDYPEYFGGEEWGQYHGENSVGGLAYQQGSNKVLSTAFDPVQRTFGGVNNHSQSGLEWLDTVGGERTGGIRMAGGANIRYPYNGKAGGIGDVEYLNAPAPIEIGNYVWEDQNGDGIQDPNEPVLQNVVVKLFKGATEVGSATTDGNGHYYFGGLLNTNMIAANTVEYTTAYQIRINLADINIGGRIPTQQDINANADDTHDSDGDNGTLNTGASTIAYTTGSAGENNHDLDFGFMYLEDWGDAPSADYATLTADNGPRHNLISTLYMGACVDEEDDGQPTATANGDDIGTANVNTLGTCATANDDEDSLTPPTLSNGQASPTVTVAVHNTTGSDAFLACWVDYSGSSFDAAERSSTVTIANGDTSAVVTLPNVPATASTDTGGSSFMRCRLASAAGQITDPTGAATSGEIEDYPITIETTYDWGDAPDPDFPTQTGNTGPNHGLDPELYMGACVDDETNGQQSATANGDDTGVASVITLGGACASGDEDSLTPPTLTDGQTGATVTVTTHNATGADAYLACWVDVTGAGFEAAERSATVTVGNGVGSVNVILPNVPTNASTTTSGSSFMRCRLASVDAEIADPTGTAAKGEVEDYPIAFIPSEDWGDAPNADYPTLSANAGPHHKLTENLLMGACVDDEADGQDSLTANGDDTGTAGANTKGTCLLTDDDEDALIPPALIDGMTAPTVNVAVVNTTGNPAYLACWVDYSSTGFEAGERSATVMVADLATTATVTLPDVPAGTSATVGGSSFMRCRLASVEAEIANPTGAAESGEIEDYPLAIAPSIDWGDAPEANYPTQSGSNGPNHELDPDLFLGACIDDEVDGQQSANAEGDDTGVAAANTQGTCAIAGDDEDALTPPSFFDGEIAPTVDIAVTNTTGVDAKLACWVDYSGSGFEIAERTAIITVPDGTTSVTMTLPDVPANASDSGSDSFMRCRLATDEADVTDPTGTATNGEVEDHPIVLSPSVDYGDAPSVDYPTTLAQNGPRHTLDPLLYMGSCVDDEAEGQQSPDADGDTGGAGAFTQGSCTTAGDDEDGLTPMSLAPGTPSPIIEVNVFNNTGADAYLACWVDYSGSGFEIAERSAIVTVPSGGATVALLTLPDVPADVMDTTEGSSYIRCRVASVEAEIADPIGPAANGEVEDHMMPFAVHPVPTLSEWALFMLMMLLAFVGYRQSVLRGGVKF